MGVTGGGAVPSFSIEFAFSHVAEEGIHHLRVACDMRARQPQEGEVD
jgi:hypothetical protein